jgi:hypothetical protein
MLLPRTSQLSDKSACKGVLIWSRDLSQRIMLCFPIVVLQDDTPWQRDRVLLFQVCRWFFRGGSAGVLETLLFRGSTWKALPCLQVAELRIDPLQDC